MVFNYLENSKDILVSKYIGGELEILEYFTRMFRGVSKVSNGVLLEFQSLVGVC